MASRPTSRGKNTSHAQVLILLNKHEDLLYICKCKSGLLVGCLVVHTRPTSVGQMVQCLLLTRQHRGLCQYFSGWEYVTKLKLTTNM